MKKIAITLITLVLITVSCKKEKKAASELFRAEFIYNDNAAVLKGADFIYGVELGEMATKLAEKVKPLKREEYDMVPVVVMGIKKPNPVADGWKEIIEITEIIGATPPTGELATKIKANSAEEPETTAPSNTVPVEEDHSGHNH